MIRFVKHLGTNIQRQEARRRRGKSAAAPRTRLCLEALEDRLVPSGNNWSMYNFDAAGTRDNRAEHILSPDNVGGLQMLWNFPTAGGVAGGPPRGRGRAPPPGVPRETLTPAPAPGAPSATPRGGGAV